MTALLIKDVDEKVLEKLKVRAERDGRSLQSEIQTILKDAAERFEQLTDAKLARKIKDSLRGANIATVPNFSAKTGRKGK